MFHYIFWVSCVQDMCLHLCTLALAFVSDFAAWSRKTLSEKGLATAKGSGIYENWDILSKGDTP